MRSGLLRKLIRIESPPSEQDADGSVLPGPPWNSWELRASIEPLSGREYIAAQSIQAEVTHRIQIRYIAGIRPRMTVYEGDRRFDILSVINIKEQNIELELICEECV